MARICMVAFTHYPPDTRVRREAEALVDRGDEVDVICLARKGDSEICRYNGVKCIQLSMDRYRGSNSLKYLTQYFHFFLIAFILLSYLHIKNPYQIIQIHTMPDFMVFVALIPKILGAKVLIDVHDLMPELYQSKYGKSKYNWMIRFITWIERGSIGFAHRAIAVHKPHLDALVKHGSPEDKFAIIMNLPDPKAVSKRAASRLDNRVFKLIYHGAVAKRHGLRCALQALAKLRATLVDVEFLIVGVGDEIAQLRQLTRELNLIDWVKIQEGWVPIEELVPSILEADVGLVPILYDDFTRFMLPVKLLEYVALGIPVICSRTETIETYFDNSMVQYFEAGNVDDLAAKILDLYQNPAKRKLLIDNADRFNRDYSWEQQKHNYYDLIDELSSDNCRNEISCRKQYKRSGRSKNPKRS